MVIIFVEVRIAARSIVFTLQIFGCLSGSDRHPVMNVLRHKFKPFLVFAVVEQLRFSKIELLNRVLQFKAHRCFGKFERLRQFDNFICIH